MSKPHAAMQSTRGRNQSFLAVGLIPRDRSSWNRVVILLHHTVHTVHAIHPAHLVTFIMPIVITSGVVLHHHLVRLDDLAKLYLFLVPENALIASVVCELVFPPDGRLSCRRRYCDGVRAGDATADLRPACSGTGGSAVVFAGGAGDVADEDTEDGDGGGGNGYAGLAGSPDDEIAAIVWHFDELKSSNYCVGILTRKVTREESGDGRALDDRSCTGTGDRS